MTLTELGDAAVTTDRATASAPGIEAPAVKLVQPPVAHTVDPNRGLGAASAASTAPWRLR